MVKETSNEKNSKSPKSDDIEGAFERQREFLEERFSSLSPKGEKPEEGKRKKFTLSRESVLETQPLSEPLPENFRLKLVKEYRERQIQKQKEHTTDSLISKKINSIDNKKKLTEQEKLETFEGSPPPLPPVPLLQIIGFQ